MANIFTGWVDVDLSEKGLGEAKGAGELLKAPLWKDEFSQVPQPSRCLLRMAPKVTQVMTK